MNKEIDSFEEISRLYPCDVKFQYSPFWIWDFNISIKSMDKDVGDCVGKEIGKPIIVDVPKSLF